MKKLLMSVAGAEHFGLTLIDLKPCPFCGGQANVIEHRFHGLDSSYGLQCKKCKAETYQFYESEEKAIKAWNRRAGEEEQHETV